MPEMFDVWMRLLTQVPGSVLWLPEYNPAETHHLRREAQSRGVDGKRIVFAKLVPTVEEYLARMALADLFLDTSPYKAHTTASDAVWLGIPVVTYLGTSFAGRVATSLMQAIGAPELSAPSLSGYEALALRLAGDKQELASLRSKIAQNRNATALFNTARYTRHLEGAYREMAARVARDEPPAHFAVSRLP
jgi:predicted O-linked N-acetylglucosamine transferase (SPINDLY family)